MMMASAADVHKMIIHADDYSNPTNRSRSPRNNMIRSINGEVSSVILYESAATEAPTTGTKLESEEDAPQSGWDGNDETPEYFSPPRWIPDDEVAACLGCKKLFDWARRKHHCRCCGRVFCSSCSNHQSLLPRSFGTRNPQRVCQPCEQNLKSLQKELVATMSNSMRSNEVSNSGISPYLNKPLSFTLGAEIRKASYSILNFLRVGIVQDSSIPMELLSSAKGLAFITVLKGGFLWVGSFGTGLIVTKLPRKRMIPGKDVSTDWSAPSAIGLIGMGWGAAVGANITDVVLILNTEAAVESFTSKRQVSLGAGIGVAAGPVGRAGSGSVAIGSDMGVAPIFSYSHSRGLFAGLSLEGAMIATRSDVNRAFYGKDIPVKELLRGDIDPPPAAMPLYESLNEIRLVNMAAA